MVKTKYSRSFHELNNIVEMTAKFFSDFDIDASLRNGVDLVIEELFVNMVNYNKNTVEKILIELTPFENGIQVSLTDYDSDRFDPTLYESADVNAALEDRNPGGLGLFLVLKMVDSIDYSYHNRQSKITFTRVESNV